MCKEEKMICHIECMGKEWNLFESSRGFWIKSPYVKTFNCLAEARKAMIAYINNPDFRDYKFKLKQFGECLR